MDFFEKIFPIIFIVIFILIGIAIVFNIVSMFSPKLRSKMFKRQLKSLNTIVKDSKDEIANFAEAGADILEGSKDSLKRIADINAEINEDAVERTAAAISRGLKK